MPGYAGSPKAHDIPTNEDFDGAEIDEEGIIPGPLITVKLMVDIALGSDAEASTYLKAFPERQSSSEDV